ncbi:MAG: cytochrome c [Pseudomonadota bacterium]
MTFQKLPLLLIAALLAGCGGGNDAAQEAESAAANEPVDANTRTSVDHTPDVIEPSATKSTVDEYDLWDTNLAFGYAVETPSTDPLVRGREVYVQWCEICHGEGVGMAGTSSLARKYQDFDDMPALLTERTDLYPAVTKLFVRQGVKSMPYFRKTEISDEDLDALAAYLAPKEE